MKQKHFVWMARSALVVFAALTGGCFTTGDAPRNPDEQVFKRYLKRAETPLQHALTVYQDEQQRWVIVNGNRLRPGQRIQASFVSPPGLPLAIIAGEGAEGACTFLVDPTSPRSWTLIQNRTALDLRPISPPNLMEAPVHVIDAREGLLSVAPHLRLDRLDVDSALLYARGGTDSLWPLNRNAAAEKVVAVLGYDFLRSLSWVQWDFEGRMLVGASDTAYAPDENRLVATLPLEAGAEALTVRALIEGKASIAMLDLAGDYELSMAEAPMALIRQITLDNVVLREVHATAARTLGLGRPDIVRIGLRLLSRYTVTLDNRRNVVYLEIPAGKNTPAPEAEAAP